MTQYACIRTNQAYLNTKFGLSLAQDWFGFDNTIIEGIVGRYSRGKRKGQLRGAIQWEKTVVGGWKRSNNGYGGRVSLPGEIRKKAIVDAFTGEVILEATNG